VIGYDAAAFAGVDLSVAMTEEVDHLLGQHLDKGPRQEDLTFAFWRPSRGARRYTGILYEAALPEDGDRILDGNVAFTANYLERVLSVVPSDTGIALLHSHLGPGWQGMSDDDVVAERDRLAGAVAGRTGLPILGLTRGTDGAWSARYWLRVGRRQYARHWASTVRIVGQRLRITFHPKLAPPPPDQPSQQATISVWGSEAQSDVARTHVGIVGLGSVGSIVAEGLSRIGLQRVTYIDHDTIEARNLDRTLGSIPEDASQRTPKVEVARRLSSVSHTALAFDCRPVPHSLLTEDGLRAALDCDALVGCVDRPWPRSVLNTIAKAHLIPLIDGGILARVQPDGRPLHVDWKIHTVGPSRRCLYCLGAVPRSDVALDITGKLDDPDYIRGLTVAERERYARRNVFPFSLSVASHEILQLVGLITGMTRIGGVGPQHYSAYPGIMVVDQVSDCDADCEVNQLTASAVDLLPSIVSPGDVQTPINPVTCANCGAIRPTELLTGAPRTACPKCGAVAITIHANIHEFLLTRDRIEATLTASSSARDWRRRWEEIQHDLDELRPERLTPFSSEGINQAAHDLHSFFIQAYHLKDALKIDARSLGIDPKDVEAAVDSEPDLALLADLANLDKHGRLDRPPRSGHVPAVISVEAITGVQGWRLRLNLEHAGKQLDGVEVATKAVDAWRRVLAGWRIA